MTNHLSGSQETAPFKAAVYFPSDLINTSAVFVEDTLEQLAERLEMPLTVVTYLFESGSTIDDLQGARVSVFKSS